MEQQIIAGLVARGVPPHIAQGIVANMIAESGLNPGVNEVNPTVAGSRGGFGLNQWTGPRRHQLEQFAAQRGTSPGDLNTQLDFTVWELSNTERQAGQALSSAPDATTAARIYSDRFLRPGVPHLDRRLAEASRLSGGAANALAGGYGPQTGPQGMPPPNMLASAQPPAQAPSFMPNPLDPAMFQRRNSNPLATYGQSWGNA